MFLTNLHNSGGPMLSVDAVRKIAQACARADPTLIVDEVYLDAAHLNGGRPPAAANLRSQDARKEYAT